MASDAASPLSDGGERGIDQRVVRHEERLCFEDCGGVGAGARPGGLCELFERYARAARQSAASTGAITLLVSHRFPTVRMADFIAVLVDGHVTEFGSHAELIEKRGTYAELFHLQAGAYV